MNRKIEIAECCIKTDTGKDWNFFKMEIWKDIQGYEGIYQISNIGNVKSLPREKRLPKSGTYICESKILRTMVDENHYGYTQIELSNNGKKKSHKIHRLVAIAFILNTENKPQVNHINGIKTDNRVENLEWCNNSENQIHAYANGLNKSKTGSDHHNSKTTKEENIFIKKAFKNKELTVKELCKKFNIDKVSIYRIIKRDYE